MQSLWSRVADVTITKFLRFTRESRFFVKSQLVTAVAGSATANAIMGTVTSEALVTAAGADYTLTLTNPAIGANDFVSVEVQNGTNTTAGMSVQRVTPGAGSVVILVRNTHATVAWNGTVKVSFFVIKAS